MDLVKQNFHQECEGAINKQINLELYSSYVYMAMSSYFARSDVALAGFHNYFKKSSEEEREHAMKLIEYQNKRGGIVVFTDVKAPEQTIWGTAKEAMMAALQLERKVNTSLLGLHTLASNHNDAHFEDFLESDFLPEQVESIKELADHVTNLERVGEGLGVYMFDKRLDE